MSFNHPNIPRPYTQIHHAYTHDTHLHTRAYTHTYTTPHCYSHCKHTPTTTRHHFPLVVALRTVQTHIEANPFNLRPCLTKLQFRGPSCSRFLLLICRFLLPLFSCWRYACVCMFGSYFLRILKISLTSRCCHEPRRFGSEMGGIELPKTRLYQYDSAITRKRKREKESRRGGVCVEETASFN